MENSKELQVSNFDIFLNAVENKGDKLTQIKYDLASISTKEELLQKAGNELKTEFIGLDEQIDQLLIYIRPWILMPESLRRPIVVSLWGMTGVGKTTLVQALIDKLMMSHVMITNDIGKYVVNENGYYEGALIQSLVNLSGQAGVLFFDEVQIVRTIGEDGREIDRPSLRSFWSLLDVGKIEVQNALFLDKKNYWKQTLKYFHSPHYQPDAPTFSDYDLMNIIPYLNLNENCKKLLIKASETNPLEVTKWIIAKIEELEQKPPILDFSKCLIILSGNIDESFAHVKTVASALLTPEELAEKVSKVSTSSVKEGLLNRFRAEQVARMGTSFVIFKNLNQKQYEKIIDKHLNIISESIKESFLLSVQFSKAVNALIAKNGIVPSQGVRPILSTIGEIIESRVPTWLITMYKAKQNFATVDFETSTQTFKLMAGDQCLYEDKLTYDKASEQTKVKLSHEELKYISVHEAGHIVAGVSLYGVLPQRVIFEEGIAQNIPPQVRFKDSKVMTRTIFETNLAVLMAGHAAEEIKFTKAGVSSGASQDFRVATDIVSHMISQVGMGSHLGVSVNDKNFPENLISLKKSDDEEKQRLLESAYAKAKHVLLEQNKFFESLSKELFENKKISIPRLQQLVKENYKGSADEIDAILKRESHKAYDILN